MPITPFTDTSPLRHGARDKNQEHERDVQKREAMQAAETAVYRKWFADHPGEQGFWLLTQPYRDAVSTARSRANKRLQRRWASKVSGPNSLVTSLNS